MPAPASPDTPLRFTDQELALLAKTADALTAYIGKPVLAEVGVSEAGHEWVAFARPLETDDETDDDDVHMQMGGPGTRWIGDAGGLEPGKDEVYDCLYLWAIQLTPDEGERFVKLDHVGDEYDSSDDLEELLPFGFTDEAVPEDDEEDQDEDDDGPDEIPGQGGGPSA